jgi:hypothetical protein
MMPPKHPDPDPKHYVHFAPNMVITTGPDGIRLTSDSPINLVCDGSHFETIGDGGVIVHGAVDRG